MIGLVLSLLLNLILLPKRTVEFVDKNFNNNRIRNRINKVKGVPQKVQDKAQKVKKVVKSLVKTGIRILKLVIIIMSILWSIVCFVIMHAMLFLTGGAVTAAYMILTNGDLMSNSGKSASTAASSNLSASASIDEWLTIVKEFPEAAWDVYPHYSQGATHKVKYNGKTIDWRPDCSGTVTACLVAYGSIDSITWTGAEKDGTGMYWKSLKGFEHVKISDISELKKGDIVLCDQHTEIILSSVSDGKCKVMNWGSPTSVDAHKIFNTHDAKMVSGNTFHEGSHDYTWIWRPIPKGGSTGGSSNLKSTEHYIVADGNWVNFLQQTWADVSFSSSTISGCGCGLCATASVLVYYSGGNVKKYNPESIVEDCKNSSKIYTNQTRAAIPYLINDKYNTLGIECTSDRDGALDLDELDKVLADGGCAIVRYDSTVANNGIGVWTTAAHYVVIRSGNQKDGYQVLDSNRYHEDKKGDGIKAWMPYCKHTFDKKYVKGNGHNYYYYIKKK